MQQPTYILDFDSTLVQSESLDELANVSLADHKDRRAIMRELEHITHRGMSGELAFDESLQARLQLFTGTRSHIDELITYLSDHMSPSALATREWFDSNRPRIYVISGGFEEYITPIATKLGIAADHIYANRFIFQDDVIVGIDTKRHTSKPGGKAAQIAALHLSHPIIAIGDGYTDYEIKAKGLADEFWAFTETIRRPQVVAHADRVLRSFSEILAVSV
jgi:D-3-phosphoglycerate dehydrogenase / 2-oxoglutarate reductase